MDIMDMLISKNELVESNTGQLLLPLLLTARQAATVLGIPEYIWHTWNSTGQAPQPIHIGRRTFWRTGDIKTWVAAGCSPCET